VKISGLDVVEGSVRICVRSMAGGPGRGLSGANDDDSVVVAVVGWHRAISPTSVAWPTPITAPDPDMSKVTTCAANTARPPTIGEGGNDESRERGVEIAWPVPPRWVRMEGVS